MLCLSAPRLLITSGMIYTPYDWLNKFYSFYKPDVVSIISVRGFTIEARHRKQTNKTKLVLYNCYFHCNRHLKQLYICQSQDGALQLLRWVSYMHIKAFKSRGGDKSFWFSSNELLLKMVIPLRN